jgi:hypothetical protein
MLQRLEASDPQAPQIGSGDWASDWASDWVAKRIITADMVVYRDAELILS